MDHGSGRHRAQNTKTLQEAGVDEKLIQQFMTNENLSPSQQTLMLTTLTTMKGVEGLEVLLRIAAEADAVDVADREIWLRGQASLRFEIELQNLGWGLRRQIELSGKIKEQFAQSSEQEKPKEPGTEKGARGR